MDQDWGLLLRLGGVSGLARRGDEVKSLRGFEKGIGRDERMWSCSGIDYRLICQFQYPFNIFFWEYFVHLFAIHIVGLISLQSHNEHRSLSVSVVCRFRVSLDLTGWTKGIVCLSVAALDTINVQHKKL